MPAGHDISAGYGEPIFKRLLADNSISSGTPAVVAGMTLPTDVGTFVFNYYIVAQSAAASTGHKFSVNYTGTTTHFVAMVRWLTNASAAADDVVDQDHVAAPGGVVSAFSARVKSTAGWGTTTDVDTLNADVLYIIEGLMVASVAGNLELYHGSDSAAATTVMAGTSLVLFKTG